MGQPSVNFLEVGNLRAMDHRTTLQTILETDPLRCRLLYIVRSLGLPDCWIAAGFVRNAVWDHLHHRPAGPPRSDVDVIWFDPKRATASEDRRIEAKLRALDPAITWSVKNQARMHLRNGDVPYASATRAMYVWPETATAVAVRQTAGGSLDVAAPFGLDDLFALYLRPTPRFGGDRHGDYLRRIEAKRWLTTWPRLRMRMRPAGGCHSDFDAACRFTSGAG